METRSKYVRFKILPCSFLVLEKLVGVGTSHTKENISYPH